MRMTKCAMLLVITLGSYCEICHAIGTGVFWGTWKTHDEKMDMTITIKSFKAVHLEIDGENIENVEFDYVYSKLQVALPFFCLHAINGDKEYSIYLTIGNGEGTADLNQLKGFYEVGELLYLQKNLGEDHGGEMNITIYPVDLVREQAAAP